MDKIAENKKNEKIKGAVQWSLTLILAVITALLIRGLIFEVVKVDGPSMESTLFTGQKLFVFKPVYMFSPPQQGDIVVLRFQEGAMTQWPITQRVPLLKKMIPAFDEVDYVKRVIGCPGDVVDIRDGHVFVNGKELKEPYAQGNTYTGSLALPVRVAEHNVFVLGDNRENSSDSREDYIGLIDYSRIKGKVLFRIAPWKDIGRIGTSLPNP